MQEQFQIPTDLKLLRSCSQIIGPQVMGPESFTLKFESPRPRSDIKTRRLQGFVGERVTEALTASECLLLEKL
jgi:hypothetical protein